MNKPRPRAHEAGLYHQFSRCYDWIFGPAFAREIHKVIDSLRLPTGAKILEIGVGTGISLEAYPTDVQLIGIDLAEEMLAQAEKKIAEHNWTHIELRQMDALNLDFPDAQFDYVMAFHVVTVVPKPRQLMQEMVRVARPGGLVVIINHFRSQRRWLARMIDLLDPLTRRIGWTTRLELDELLKETPLIIERRYKSSPRSLYTILYARRR